MMVEVFTGFNLNWKVLREKALVLKTLEKSVKMGCIVHFTSRKVHLYLYNDFVKFGQFMFSVSAGLLKENLSGLLEQKFSVVHAAY